MKSTKEKQSEKISHRNSLKAETAAAHPSDNSPAAEAKTPGASVKTKNWMMPPPPVPDSKIYKTIKVDVVILGAGNGGTAAARAAAQAGASVAVLEKQAEDKHTFNGGEIGVINSQFVLKAGVKKIDPMDYVREWQRRTGNRTNPLLIRQFAYNSGAALDWFLELLPPSFKDTLNVVFKRTPKHFTGEVDGVRSWPGSVTFYGKKEASWSDAMKLMVAKAKDLGAAFYFATAAEQLIKEGNRVTGVIAKDGMGNYLKFLARKGVLLACGDFSRNREMVADLMNELVDFKGGTLKKFLGVGREGDGQKMGIWAGGRMEPGPRALLSGPWEGDAGAFGWTAFLRMNRYGKRFTNEASWAAGFQGIRQPKGPVCAVWDADWRKELEYQSLDHGNVDTSHGKNLARIEAEMKALCGTGAMGGNVCEPFSSYYYPAKTYCAETLDELADYLGYKDEAKKNFLATIERYNKLARKGKDEDFGKDSRLMHPITKPPYYGYVDRNDGMTLCLATLSGLVVDEYQNVLDENDDPIPGLYATGDCCGGRYALNYITPISGNGIGMPLTLGRIVGQHIAKL
jgi:NAD(P)-dependent dehydrogenase (short-subunit alcohol dehydrogenase family)